jgi:predicted enzyme related to lactoylglutathione lyase
MNRIVHFEFGAADPERAANFYRNAFGWAVQKWGGPTEYWLVTTGPNDEPGINGGIMRHQDGAARTVNTITVADVDAAIAAVVANGGSVAHPKFPIPGIGWQAYCLDTEGNLFGVHQENPQAG